MPQVDLTTWENGGTGVSTGHKKQKIRQATAGNGAEEQ